MQWLWGTHLCGILPQRCRQQGNLLICQEDYTTSHVIWAEGSFNENRDLQTSQEALWCFINFHLECWIKKATAVAVSWWMHPPFGKNAFQSLTVFAWFFFLHRGLCKWFIHSDSGNHRLFLLRAMGVLVPTPLVVKGQEGKDSRQVTVHCRAHAIHSQPQSVKSPISLMGMCLHCGRKHQYKNKPTQACGEHAHSTQKGPESGFDPRTFLLTVFSSLD